MRVWQSIRKHGLDAQTLRSIAIVKVQLHPISEGRSRNTLLKSHALPRTAAVVHAKGGAKYRKSLRHAQDGRHAYATGQEQVVRRIRFQREMISRRTDLQHIAFGHKFVHSR
ncbi:hypothetical protein CTS44_23813 [Comamonas thiooxydans]|nr:hypothetical protein CTS44_23813 [Comamonas thiooxydans]